MAKKSTAVTTAKRGRPSNATLAARSQASKLTKIAVAAASAAISSALADGLAGITGSVTPITSAKPKARTATGKPVGRPVKATSSMSKARAFYDANYQSMERSDMVDKLHKSLNITKQSANTYVSLIDKENGYKLVSTRRNKAA